MPPKRAKRPARKQETKQERTGRPGGPKVQGDKPPESLGAEPRERTRSRSRLRRGDRKDKKKGKKEKKQPQVGLFVTKELAQAIETTKSTVERIARECRAKNRRFRDPEFDLEYDQWRCLHGYSQQTDVVGKDVQRVTEIFDHPEFFLPGGAAQSTAIRQGGLGDCYFLSALATVSSLPGLIEKICVARDEQVGIYGFIFYQDRGWVGVIVDDMLYTKIPKYESLDQAQKEVYHEDKERFNEIARKGGQVLIYAKAGTSHETWVPIIEKAYAKLYGCYAHIGSGGQTREAIEDLTGGVASNLNARDILDVDQFWKEELSRVNKDRLFACALDSPDAPADAPWADPTVQGLIGGHAYAVLRAAEVNGKRFVVLRNPWGQSEWTGPWSDGSKEWTAEWLKLLPQLKHSFGDDGQFVMEYKDFLRYFTDIDRVLLFNDTWTVASCWLNVPIAPIPAAPAYGMLSFHVNIPAESKNKTKVIFVLSQLNNRSFESIEKDVRITFEFSVVKVGELGPIATGSCDRPFSRSGSVELDLEAGDYMVYVKLDQIRNVDPNSDYSDWNIPYKSYPNIVNPSARVISRILTNKVKALSLTQNWDTVGETDYVVKSLEDIIKQDLEDMNASDSEEETDEDDDDDDDSGSSVAGEASKPASEAGEAKPSTEGAGDGEEKKPEDGVTVGEVTIPVPDDDSDSEEEEEEVSPVEWVDLIEDKGDEAALGLRVYTQTKDPALVVGRIKSADETWEL
ncbi:hypothetical protein EST38_g1918 [Candolleomyces aberdarensis]|uniref:Calpain catalytic domain-containing protein n=1 Tax=Candolleomyces aberdarensis TaxID=2316362 RepID=A0A4Q2DXF6_9AGAR|nr:hypothetical protein EST38_g1918 [Candolleomyces aberdarensis]